MKESLVKEFYDRWPTWFSGLDLDERPSCLAFECGDGWRDLLWGLCEKLDSAGVPFGFKVKRVKEKFGGLRFYTSGCSQEASTLIAMAEAKSYVTCEHCGNLGATPETSNGWINTRCKACREGR